MAEDSTNPVAVRWDRRYAAKELIWSAGPNALFATEVADIEPGRALDAGCGEGRNAIWLAEQGWQVTAVDISAVGIDKARRIAERRGVHVDWQVADVTTLPARGYDLLACLYLHTDSESRAQWLPHLVDMVLPGGTFIYIGHDPRNIAEGVGGPQDPSVLPDANEITEVLGDRFETSFAGVHERIVAAETGHGHNDAEARALDCLVRAIRLS